MKGKGNMANKKETQIKGERNKIEVPVWEKLNLTVEEMAAYSGIGINKIKELSNDENCKFVLWVGNKRLIKRKKFDEYIENQFSI